MLGFAMLRFDGLCYSAAHVCRCYESNTLALICTLMQAYGPELSALLESPPGPQLLEQALLLQHQAQHVLQQLVGFPVVASYSESSAHESC